MIANTYLRLLRPWFWPPAIGPALTGYLMTATVPSLRDIFLVTIIFGPCIGGLAEVINEIADTYCEPVFKQWRAFGINSSGNLGLLRSNPRLLRISFLLAVITALTGVILAFSLNPKFALVVMLGQLLAISYSAPPIRVKRFSFGGIIMRITGYGLIAITAGVLATGAALSIKVLVAGLGVGAIVGGFSSTADLADRATDEQNRVNTLATMLGVKPSSYIYSILILVGLLLLTILSPAVRNGESRAAWRFLIMGLIAICSIVCVTYILRYPENEAKMSRVHLVGVVLESIAPLAFLVV